MNLSHQTHLVLHVVRRQLLQHLGGESLNAGLPRLPGPAPGVLWLDADDGAERLIGQVGLVGDVSVRVEPKHLQTGSQRFNDEAVQGLDILGGSLTFSFPF